MSMAAIYARVSSERQKEEQTIGSQLSALREYAEQHGYRVPAEWIFADEGYSGSTLVRPGLERVRDLAWEGQIEALLVYAPDRLSRKYAYQVLLMEELNRQGVEVLFLRSTKAETPEEQLLVQFQGMIAEYERAQIGERTRRGKRHRARMGSINVLCGAPYGYRYMKKTDTSAAYYEVLEPEAEVVRRVFRFYTEDGSSIAAIVRRLNEEGIPTRRGGRRWERSTVWAMLRNPAYESRACFGKTKRAERTRMTRPLRQRGGFTPRVNAHQDCPREAWIEIAVPALVESETFALAHELLEKNKRYASRRTIEPTLLQGILVCRQCGYALYRTSTRTSKRKLYYYRCLGSDNYRFPQGRICDHRPIRQDYLDGRVWRAVLELLEDPDLIRAEIRRRMVQLQDSNPRKRKVELLGRELTRMQKGIAKLLDAYQEGLLDLDELRRRMPELRKREKTLSAELTQLQTAAVDEQTFLRVADQLGDFLARLRHRAEALNITERQKILRLVVKEILVDREKITIRHSIPIMRGGIYGEPVTHKHTPSYLLRSGRRFAPAQ